MSLATVISQNAPLVRTVLLQDANGVVQAIVPEHALLDLRKLHAFSDRKLLAVPQELLPQVNRRKKLRQLDVAPFLFELPTLIDTALEHAETLNLEILDGDGASVESVPMDAVRRALEKHALRLQFGPLAIPAEELDQQVARPEADNTRIRKSIKDFSALRIRQRLHETLEIPPLPSTAEQIVRLRQNPNASVRDLIRIVESDPSLAAQVVSWAASPFYAASGRIRSVSDAIVRVLGFDMVSNMALGLVIGRNISIPREGISGMTPFWQQAVYCATAVEALYRLLPPRHRPQQGLAYLGGLLHNFGYLVLAHSFPPHFTMICRYVEANPALSHVAIEHHLIGVSREQISAWLMNCWGMPEEIAVALRFQHDAGYNGKHAIYAHLIYIALRLLRSHGIGDAPVEPVSEAIFQRYGLGRDEVEEVIAMIVNSREVRKIADHLAS